MQNLAAMYNTPLVRLHWWWLGIDLDLDLDSTGIGFTGYFHITLDFEQNLM